jgi:hypothetical protein
MKLHVAYYSQCETGSETNGSAVDTGELFCVELYNPACGVPVVLSVPSFKW